MINDVLGVESHLENVWFGTDERILLYTNVLGYEYLGYELTNSLIL